MESLFRYVAEPSPCGYLREQRWSLEYEYVSAMTEAEYLQRMLEGWRRFGTMLFRPACARCQACQALRIPADRFRPDRSQRRCRKGNEGVVELRIGQPSVTREKLLLYDRYHAHQAQVKGWPEHPGRDARSYTNSFVDHPFPVEEWCYYREGKLIGVGYVDHLFLPPVRPANLPDEDGRGLSAIYFFYDPDERDRSLGTWNVLCMLDECLRRQLPFLYLGYYVAGCPSMEYKPRFVPNELRQANNDWMPYRV